MIKYEDQSKWRKIANPKNIEWQVFNETIAAVYTTLSAITDLFKGMPWFSVDRKVKTLKKAWNSNSNTEWIYEWF